MRGGAGVTQVEAARLGTGPRAGRTPPRLKTHTARYGNYRLLHSYGMPRARIGTTRQYWPLLGFIQRKIVTIYSKVCNNINYIISQASVSNMGSN